MYVISILSLGFKNNLFFKICKLMVILIITLIYGLRHEIGSDWSEYLKYYSLIQENKITLAEIYDLGFSFGFAYPLIIKMLTDLGLVFNAYLALHSLLLILGINYFLCNFEEKKEIPFLITSIFTSTIGCWGSDRQLIGLSISIAALVFLFRSKYIHYILLIILASIFHSYNLIFFVFIASIKIKPSLRSVLFFIASALAFFSILNFVKITDLIGFLSNLDQNLLRYTNSDLDLGLALLTLAFKLLLIAPGLIWISKLSNAGFFYIYKINLIFLLVLIFSYFYFPPFYQRSLFLSNFFDVVMIFMSFKVIFPRLKLFGYLFLIFFCTFKGYRSIEYAYDSFIPYRSIINF